MKDATGEAGRGSLRVECDRRLKLEFHGSRVTSDAGLLAFRELDNALGLTEMAGEFLTDNRTGRNGRHSLTAQLRQAVLSRLAGYADGNDAERLGCDPAMRWVVGGRAVTARAASTSQMGRFETCAMTDDQNLTALADLSGQWIDRVQTQRARTTLVLDIDSSVSPTYGAQEGSTRSNGRDSRARPSGRTPCASSCMPWRTISPTSCAPWRCRRRSRTGPSRVYGRSW